jgi:tRNA nucleotidyltransferase (CCA-adding enzyme)
MPGYNHAQGECFLTDLPHRQQAVLAQVAALAAQQGSIPWIVGGVVRDWLLGLPATRDLDLAIEGDTLALAHALVAAGGQLSAQHRAFETASVVLDGLTLDLARTRIEHYPRPGALPEVQPARIENDLARRDFSINALAVEIRLHDGRLACGRWLDLFAGRDDLAAGRLRVLHEQSFRDDATRILRGLRLAVRLGMDFAPPTRALLDAALEAGDLATVGPDRLRTELCLTLEEPDPAAVARRANALGIAPHLFAPLQHAADCPQAAWPNLPPLVRAGLLTYALTPDEREALIARYRLPNDAARVLREVGRLREHSATLQQPNLRASELDVLLRPFSSTALDVVRYMHDGTIAAHIVRYVDELRPTAPLLDGHALRALGVAPGPRLGALLAELRAARLDGLVQTRADEEAWVRQRLAEQAAAADVGAPPNRTNT